MQGGSPLRRWRKTRRWWRRRRRWRRTAGWAVRTVKLVPMKDFFHLWSQVLGTVTPSIKPLIRTPSHFHWFFLIRRELEEGTDLEQLASRRNTCEFCGKVSSKTL